MSDEPPYNDDGESFDDLYENARDISDLGLEKPDITDYLDLGYDSDHYIDAWEHAPVEDFTEGQLETFAEMLVDWDGDWDELMEMWDDGGFWDWWESEYNDQ